MIGSTIGKYHVTGQIGRGATGIVYKAIDQTLDREVAIKVLNPDSAGTEVMKRFRAEATTLARLNHPEIATIYELLPTETDLLMVMEFVRGDTLEKFATRLSPMAPDRAAYLVDKILSGLEYAHRVGIVHRDMKPANVMVTDLGGVKIMDFGIARVRGAEHMTIDGALMGTPAYMAPEQVLGHEVDGRADLYAVGVMFYRLMAGALPFAADTAIGMLQQQVTNVPTALHVHRTDLPDWCETIVQRALAKSPDDRFQTAEEFRAALSRATGTAPAIDTAKAFAEPVILATVAIPRAHITQPAPHRPTFSTAVRIIRLLPTLSLARAGPMLALIAVLIPVVMVTVLAYVALRRSGIEPMTSAMLPPVFFDAKMLVGGRQRDARLVLADGKITVTPTGNTRPLHSVPYGGVISISYSRSRDPMWNSPKGPARLARSGGGSVLEKLDGLFIERHWVSLRTDGQEKFVILRIGDEQVRRVLAALEERTSHKPERIFDP